MTGLAEVIEGLLLRHEYEAGSHGHLCRCGARLPARAARLREDATRQDWHAIHVSKEAEKTVSAWLQADEQVEKAARAVATLNAPRALPDNMPDAAAYKAFGRAALAAVAGDDDA